MLQPQTLIYFIGSFVTEQHDVVQNYEVEGKCSDVFHIVYKQKSVGCMHI